MDRINDPSAVADKHGSGKDGWTDGTPSTPGSGTVIRENFMDGVQEELVTLIEAAGITPNETTFNQVRLAISELYVEYANADKTIEFSSLADDQTPLFTSTDLPAATYKLISEYATKTNDTIRTYINDLNQFWVLFNATSDGTNFTKDASASADPVAIILSGFSSNPTFGLYRWTGSGFTDAVSLGTVAPAAPSDNTLYPDNVPKAWGRLTITSGTPAVSASESFNIASHTTVDSTSNKVTLANGVATATSGVAMMHTQHANANGIIVQPRFDSATEITYSLWDIGTDALVTLTSENQTLGITVFGKQ